MSEAEGVRGIASSSSNLTFGLDGAEISKSDNKLKDRYQQIFFIHLEQDGGKVCSRKLEKKTPNPSQKGEERKPRHRHSRAIHHLSPPSPAPTPTRSSERGTTPTEIDFRASFQSSSVSFRRVTKRCFSTVLQVIDEFVC